MNTKKKPRILIAKPGLNGHDRGAKVVAMALRDAGMDVIYTGRHKSPEEIVSMAIEKNVDLIGLSILSGAHIYLTRKVLELLREKGINIPVIVGGAIPDEDIPILKGMGVIEVFPTGSSLKEIVSYIKNIVSSERRSEEVSL